MALVNAIKVGDQVSHYGEFVPVVKVEDAEGGLIKLTLKEDGREVIRTEAPKTNLPVWGE